MTGERALGWYTGRDSPNTRRLVADYGGFEYDSDYYGDDLPFWLQVKKSDGSLAPHLVVPYTLDCNDMRFALPQGFSHGEAFFQYAACRNSSTTSSATTACGSRAVSTSRATGGVNFRSIPQPPSSGSDRDAHDS